MKFPSLLAASLLTGLGNAAVIFPGGFKDFKCDKFDFNKKDNQNGAEAAYQYKDNPIGLPGQNPFPHTYGNSDTIVFEPQCNGKTLKEFPLEHLTTWDGTRNAGRFRVVVAFNGTDTLYCGAMYHPEGSKTFRPCPWSKN